MDRPLIIGNVHNLSLEGYSDEQPQLVAQFPCQTEVNTCFYITNPVYGIPITTCCSTIWLHNVSLFTVKTLTITPKTPNVTGLVLSKVVNATIEQIEVYLISESITSSQQGIVLMDCHFIQMHSIIARNWKIGLVFTDSNNIHIHNVTAYNNDEMGIFILNSSNFHLYSSIFTNNTFVGGIVIYAGYNIVINNTTSVCNSWGIHFEGIETAQIVNTIVSNNTDNGMVLLDSININISNTTLSHNDVYGLLIFSSSSIHIDGITINDNTYYGIYLLQSKWIYISRFTTLNTHSDSNYTQLITIQISQYISIYDTNITVNMSVVSSGDLFSQPAVITLINSTLNLSRCTFMGNRISCIKATASRITLSGNLTFSNNSAYTGSVFILVDDSILILTENCRVYFINNHATNTGGVFFISNTQKLINMYFCNDRFSCILSVYPISYCFLRTQMDNSSTQNFILFPTIQLEREGI